MDHFPRSSAGHLQEALRGTLRQLPLGVVGGGGQWVGRSFPPPGWSVSLGFLHVVYFPGWERVWNRRPRVGKDQGLFLVACYGGVLEGHLQAPGYVWHAVGPVVW